MAKRSLLSAMLQQSKAAAKEQQRAEASAARAHALAEHRREQARLVEERALAKAQKAEMADQKRLQKELQAAHVAFMTADVEEQNAHLAEVYDEIDSLLATTLVIDDFVDLESLRANPDHHPPFDANGLDLATVAPPPIAEPVEPVFKPAESVGGLFSKKKQAAADEDARQAFTRAHERWKTEMSAVPAMRERAQATFDAEESARLAKLNSAKATYDAECVARAQAAVEHNKNLDILIANLGYGTAEAIEEYVSIVLANSVYPDHFPIEHDFTFDSGTGELALQAQVPSPDVIPPIKSYKYVKASDEIKSTDLSQKAQKDRYAGAVHQVALRTLHEVFEADRRGLIKSIALQVGAIAPDPATGQPTFTPFVAVGAERESFLEIDLSGVVPAATLDHLGASVSKNPFGLVAASIKGVRST